MKASTKLLSLLVGVLILTYSCSLFDTEDLYAPYTEEVTNLQVVKLEVGIKLTWNDPVDSDFRDIAIRRYIDGEPRYINIEAGVEEAIFEELNNELEWTFLVQAVNISNNRTSEGVEITYYP